MAVRKNRSVWKVWNFPKVGAQYKKRALILIIKAYQHFVMYSAQLRTQYTRNWECAVKLVEKRYLTLRKVTSRSQIQDGHPTSAITFIVPTKP